MRLLGPLSDISVQSIKSVMPTFSSAGQYPQRSRRANFISQLTSRLLQQSIAQPIEWMRVRQNILKLFSSDMARVDFSTQIIAGVPCVVCEPRDSATESVERTLIYLHGGGYVVGSARGYKATLATLSVMSRARVIGVEYRLAPEHVFPAAHDDCLAVTREVLATSSVPVVMAGDSAGGALCIDVLAQLHEQHQPGDRSVAACTLISPWVDPAFVWPEVSAEKQAASIGADILSPALLDKWISTYLNGSSLKSSRVNFTEQQPLFLPKTYIQVAGAEIFYEQVMTFHQSCRDAGVDVTLDNFPSQFHVFQTFGALVPEARAALGKVGEFFQGS
tara:strand:- start:39840 stop:40838 length:999 start_codon:yes stop_codon:yes gene_type:complete